MTAATDQRIPRSEQQPRDRATLWWDVAFVALLGFQAALGIFEASEGAPLWFDYDRPAARTVMVLAPLVGIGALYTVLGRRALQAGMSRAALGRSGTTFLVMFVVLLAFAVFCTPLHAILQALVYPTVWSTVMRYRDAVIWSVATGIAVSASMYLSLRLTAPEAAVPAALITGIVSLVFAIAMGTWILRIFSRGESYRIVAERLRHAQGEIALLSKEAGAAAERERLSRELHDTLAQTLTGLVMLSEQAGQALTAGDTGRARERLARVECAARSAVGEARVLVAGTHALGDGGLEESIRRVAHTFAAEGALEVTCEVERTELERELQVVLMRAVQEGLANVRKHARASRVAVRLRHDPGTSAEAAQGDGRRTGGFIVLTVEDDGIGQDQDELGGFGLQGLRDRVRLVGGEMELRRGEPSGSVLEERLGPESPKPAVTTAGNQ